MAELERYSNDNNQPQQYIIPNTGQQLISLIAENGEVVQLKDRLNKYISTAISSRIRNLLSSNPDFIINGKSVPVKLSPNQNIRIINSLNSIPRVNIYMKVERELVLEGESIDFSIFLVKIDDIDYIAFEIPDRLKSMKFKDMLLGKRLKETKLLPSYLIGSDKFKLKLSFLRSLNPNFIDLDFERCIGKDWIIWEVGNEYSKKNIVPSAKKGQSSPISLISDLLIGGRKFIDIEEILIIGEIIKIGLGNKYLNFVPEGDYKPFPSFQDKLNRKKIKQIEDYLLLSFSNPIFIGGRRANIKSAGVYIGNGGKLHPFIVGGENTHGFRGGPLTLSLPEADISLFEKDISIRTSI